jgi:hypothetical protein
MPHMRTVLLAVLLVPSVLIHAKAAAPETPAASQRSDQGKNHFLYMGADFQVQYEDGLYPVKGIADRSFIIEVKGKKVPITPDRGDFSMKIKRGLKMSDLAVKVENLKTEQNYTPANHPSRKWMASHLAVSDSARETAQIAETRLVGTPEMVNGQVNPNFTAAQHSYASASAMANSDITSTSYLASKLQEEMDKKLFDALDMSFEIASPKPLDTPYLIVIAQFKEKDKPASSRNMVYAKELSPIRGDALKVKFTQGGFPPGFILDKVQVHVYEAGRELSSNLAENQVPLNDDEAHTYLLIEHVSSNKGATLPAAPVMGKIPVNSRTLLGEKRFTHVYFVKVTKNGLPTEVFTNEACSEKADDEVQALVSTWRFLPALDKGKNIEGVSRFRISDLPL